MNREAREVKVYAALLHMSPEALKPFAEAMLPNAIAQMEEQQLIDLETTLADIADKDDPDKARALIAFAKALGADPSMFNMPELQGLV